MSTTARRAATRALETPLPSGLALPAALQADLRFVSDAEMRELNRDFRGKDKPTDVLSFALLESADDAPDVPDLPPGEALPLGDLVLAVETAHRQAAESAHSLPAEVAFLAIHGALHLLGHDHHAATPRRRMFRLQDELFARLQAQS